MSKKEYRLPRKFCEEKWFPALESGNFKQADGELYNAITGGYCCLGIAGHVCGIEDSEMKPYGYFIHPDAVGRSDGEQSLRVLALSKGLPEELLHNADDSGLAFKLASMNDNKNTFPEIAQWIKENVELYDES